MNKNTILKTIEKLLDQQTVVILDAIDGMLKKSEERINKKIYLIEKKVDKFEEKRNEKIDKLTAIADKLTKEKFGTEIT